jgi:hypothetical protein
MPPSRPQHPDYPQRHRSVILKSDAVTISCVTASIFKVPGDLERGPSKSRATGGDCEIEATLSGPSATKGLFRDPPLGFYKYYLLWIPHAELRYKGRPTEPMGSRLSGAGKAAHRPSAATSTWELTGGAGVCTRPRTDLVCMPM